MTKKVEEIVAKIQEMVGDGDKVVYYVKISESRDNYMSFRVRNEHVDGFQITPEELDEAAVRNTAAERIKSQGRPAKLERDKGEKRKLHIAHYLDCHRCNDGSQNYF